MPETALQLNNIGLDEERNVAVDFTGKLDTSELLTGTPTVTEVDTTHFTISTIAINTAAVEINGVTVAIGNAVQFKIVPGGSTLKGTVYSFDIEVNTDGSQVLTGRVTVVTK